MAMERGLKIFLAIIAVSSLIIIAVGGAQLSAFIGAPPSGSDALGEWKLSKYKGYSFDGELTEFTSGDPKAADYSVTISSASDLITGSYSGSGFKGAMNGRIFEASFITADSDYLMFGYLDSASEMHLGVLMLKDGKVSSSMSVYNRDGSRTVYEDNCKTIIGDWYVNTSVNNGTPIAIGTASVSDQDYSIIRGEMTYSPDVKRTYSGFITPLLMGTANYGMIIDTDGNVWSTLSTRGQIRIMNGYSEYLMTKDGGFVQSFVSIDLEGLKKHDSGGPSVWVKEQSSYTIMGIVDDGKEYELYGNYISSDSVISVILKDGSDVYSGFMTYSNGKVTISAVNGTGEAIVLEMGEDGLS